MEDFEKHTLSITSLSPLSLRSSTVRIAAEEKKLFNSNQSLPPPLKDCLEKFQWASGRQGPHPGGVSVLSSQNSFSSRPPPSQT